MSPSISACSSRLRRTHGRSWVFSDQSMLETQSLDEGDGTDRVLRINRVVGAMTVHVQREVVQDYGVEYLYGVVSGELDGVNKPRSLLTKSRPFLFPHLVYCRLIAGCASCRW